MPIFQGLPQSVEHSTSKFRGFVQEQHAVMRQGYFSRPRNCPATDEPGIGNTVVRSTEWTDREQRLVGRLTVRPRYGRGSFRSLLPAP